ncbi:hypothetical protein LLH03_04185 [bacterium]|nr:hypothetical protein [bacterium]
MRATIRDPQTLVTIAPLELALYLRSTGWRQESQVRDKFSTWVTCEPGAKHELALPLRQDFRDYAFRIADVLSALEEKEARSQLEIVRDLQETLADVLRVRARWPETADGSVPIDRAVNLVTYARDMMMAAACAAVGPRAYFQTRKPAQAAQYVDRLRMGQTERGSFVITVVSKVSPVLSAAEAGHLFPDMDEPFERKVTTTLAQALTATREATVQAASQGSADSFLEAVERGVSANLCDSLVGMSQANEDHGDLTISFSWSRTRPLREPVASQVEFSADTMPVIEEAGRVLRGTLPREEFEVVGLVTNLARGPEASSGVVSVLAFVDDKPRKVKMELSEGAYAKAVYAHGERKAVTCCGELVKEGGAFRLQNPRGFSIQDEDSDD